MDVPFDLPGSHREQRLGAIQRLDLRFLVDAEHQRVVRRVEIEADDVAHLVDKQGSADSLKVSLRCGWSENARQMRCTVEIDKPEALAVLAWT